MGIKVLRLQEIVSNTRYKQGLEEQSNVQPQINLERRRGQKKADVRKKRLAQSDTLKENGRETA